MMIHMLPTGDCPSFVPSADLHDVFSRGRFGTFRFLCGRRQLGRLAVSRPRAKLASELGQPRQRVLLTMLRYLRWC